MRQILVLTNFYKTHVSCTHVHSVVLELKFDSNGRFYMVKK